VPADHIRRFSLNTLAEKDVRVHMKGKIGKAFHGCPLIDLLWKIFRSLPRRGDIDNEGK
jgi:hypothetical protein